MQDFPTKYDGTTVVSAAELNNLFQELESAVQKSGLSLSSGDSTQLSQALSVYATCSSYMAASGTGSPYVLVTDSPLPTLSSLPTGTLIRFVVPATNSGAVTVTVDGLGPYDVKQKDGTTAVGAGDLSVNSVVTIVFDGTYFRVMSLGFSSTLTASTPSGSANLALPSARLTLTASTPVVLGDQSGTTLYYSPYAGNTVGLWTGSGWAVVSMSGDASISVPATTNTVYDVFAYKSGSNVLLELTAWTDSLTRSVALALHEGRHVKSSDYTRLYVGSFATDSVSGTAYSTSSRRLVYNHYNKVGLLASASYSGRAYGTYLSQVSDPTYGVNNFPSTPSPIGNARVLGETYVKVLYGLPEIQEIAHHNTLTGLSVASDGFYPKVFQGVGIDSGFSAAQETTVSADTYYQVTGSDSSLGNICRVPLTSGLHTLESTFWLPPIPGNVVLQRVSYSDGKGHGLWALCKQ